MNVDQEVIDRLRLNPSKTVTMTGITDIPQELVTMITDFLKRRDHFQLATTCRHINQLLIPYLWREIHMESDFPQFSIGFRTYVPNPITSVKPVIAASRLKQHAPFVHTLNLHGPFGPDYYTIKFPWLHTLEFHYDGTFHAPYDRKGGNCFALDADMWAEEYANSTSLLRLNPNIQNLYVLIYEGASQPPADFWDAVSSTLRNSTRLQVTWLENIERNTLEAFWRACDQFEEIDIKGSNMEYTAHLEITFGGFTQQGFDTRRQLDWFKRCPRLTRLHWAYFSVEFPNDKFVEALDQGAWPKLEGLSLDQLNQQDDVLAKTLAHLLLLRRFQLRSFKFGPLTFETLPGRLFDGVRMLDMARVLEFTSPMALGVLEGCVHLEDFRTFFINADDIDTTATRRPPWVCLGLKRLTTTFVCTSAASNEKAFMALSRLTNLEHVAVGHEDLRALQVRTSIPSFTSSTEPLKWKLDRGLGHLETLKKLRNVMFPRTEQCMDEDDLKWMVKNWSALEEVKDWGV
ncbi:hypothetical protein BGZ47_005175 [Haplosporangium gracile]|nr:hypothetical protein BGZ47_005175 [Haplosporangium gracile]